MSTDPTAKAAMTELPAILGCPFCGEKPLAQPSQHEWDEHGCFESFECPNEDCPGRPCTKSLSYPAAIAAWNARATPDAASVEAMREAAAKFEDAIDEAIATFDDAPAPSPRERDEVVEADMRAMFEAGIIRGMCIGDGEDVPEEDAAFSTALAAIKEQKK